MEPTITVAIIGMIEALGVAIIGGLLARANKRSEDYQKQAAEREHAREERDARLYDLIFAVSSGTEVLLHNAHGEKVNGNVDEALAEIRKAKAECNHVFNKQAAKL